MWSHTSLSQVLLRVYIISNLFLLYSLPGAPALALLLHLPMEASPDFSLLPSPRSAVLSAPGHLSLCPSDSKIPLTHFSPVCPAPGGSSVFFSEPGHILGLPLSPLEPSTQPHCHGKVSTLRLSGKPRKDSVPRGEGHSEVDAGSVFWENPQSKGLLLIQHFIYRGKELLFTMN
jgi:hypothetical protein